MTDTRYVFDWTFGKRVGLYQMLCPDTARVRGRNVFHAVVLAGALYMLAVFAFCPRGLYRLTGDFAAFAFYAGVEVNHLFGCYKIAVVLRHSDALWSCADVTRADFACRARHRDDGETTTFRLWLARTARIVRAFAGTCAAAYLFWVSTPWAARGAAVTVTNPDRSRTQYRLNIFNLHLTASGAAYDAHFGWFYAVELLCISFYAYFTFVFDVIMLMMCFAISCQLELINGAIASLGLFPKGTEDIKLKYEHDTFYDELKIIITDHQKVLKKIDEFYNIFRSVILIQVFVASFSHIVCWVITALNYYSKSEVSDSILSMKMTTILPIFTFELFMSCSLFEIINEKKDSIVFALYSSNWTKMDMRCKKLILLAMKMNNANHVQIKFTNTRIVNLEMFTSTMRFCYSVFSMLINYNRNQIT